MLPTWIPLLFSHFLQSTFYTWRVVFLISAAAYVGSAVIFACLVPAEAQEWNFPKKPQIDVEKCPPRTDIEKVEPPKINTEESKDQD